MKDIHIGLLASIALHLCLLALLFLFASRMDNTFSKVISVDLRFLSDDPGTARQSSGSGAIERGKGRLQRFVKPSQGEGDLENQRGQPARQEGAYPLRERGPEVLSKDSRKSSGMAAGSQDEAVAGQARTASVNAKPTGEGFQSHAGSGGGQNEMGARQGAVDRPEGLSVGGMLQGGKDFSAIRDAIIKNIRYPERARRMGLEGTVLLSFVLMEDGSTAQIRVAQGSGFGFLDEDAKRAVAKTRIARRVPYRSQVLLPVVYSLRQAPATP